MQQQQGSAAIHFESVSVFQGWSFSFHFQQRGEHSRLCANFKPIFETYLFLRHCKLHVFFSY